MSESTLSHLRCSACAATYSADVLHNLAPCCGRPLLACYDLERAARSLTPAALAAAFPPPTLLVFRTPSFFAGDDTWAEKNQGRRWYSHAKIARIKALLTDELLSGELKGRLLVWDVFSVGAGRPIAETKLQSGTCRAGHERSEFSQLQNMLLLNMLCPSEA